MVRQTANRLNQLGTETAFAVSDMANAWREQGNRVFPFHLGDINIPPPKAIITEVNAAIQNGKNGYCPGAGIPLLREQIVQMLSATHGNHWSPDNVAVQPGGKPVIGKFLAASINPGDAVAYPVPGFPIYESQINYHGGKPMPYYYRPQKNGHFALDIASMQRAITPKTRALIFNNYHNPTGAAASDEELDAVAELATANDLWVLVDDAYFNIRYDNEPPRSILIRDDMVQRAIVLFTFSKQFAMTGWRVGAAIGNRDIIAAIAKMNTNIESCTTHFIQHAIGEALQNNTTNEDAAGILSELDRRRITLCEQLNNINGLHIAAPLSAFYVYCDLSEIMRRQQVQSIDELMRNTLTATGVSFCTGEHFGEKSDTTYARFAFSGISTDDISAGIAALKSYFERD